MIERIRTIATASVTWLTFAGVVATAAVDELADWPDLADVAGHIAIAVGVAVAIIRRVTPVATADRGIV